MEDEKSGEPQNSTRFNFVHNNLPTGLFSNSPLPLTIYFKINSHRSITRNQLELIVPSGYHADEVQLHTPSSFAPGTPSWGYGGDDRQNTYLASDRPSKIESQSYHLNGLTPTCTNAIHYTMHLCKPCSRNQIGSLSRTSLALPLPSSFKLLTVLALYMLASNCTGVIFPCNIAFFTPSAMFFKFFR